MKFSIESFDKIKDIFNCFDCNLMNIIDYIANFINHETAALRST